MRVSRTHFLSAALRVAVAAVLLSLPTAAAAAEIPKPLDIRVLISEGQEVLKLTVMGGYRIVDPQTQKTLSVSKRLVGVNVRGREKGLLVAGVKFPEVIEIHSDNSADLFINNRPFRGFLTIHCQPDNTLSVVNHIDVEDYLYGVLYHEVGSWWPMEALKAQAIAARTYAYRYKSQGSSICTNEACQVYNAGKADNPPDAWRQAVEQTRGQVLEDVTTYYSSTTGGYVTPLGWDTTDGQGGSNFLDRAYEKLAGSPWVIKAWYRKGYSSSGDSCGRSSPWLSSSEMADIINAAQVLYNGGSNDETSRITPVTTSCWGGNPYSPDDLRSVSDKYGGGISSVTGVSVNQGSGTTNEVVFQTDKGEKRFSGSNFKTAFNLRAPGYTSIPQSGFAFFSIEKK